MTDTDSLQKTATLTIDQALRQAVAHHQAGRLPEAEQLYRAILQAHPNHPDANHNLGVLAVQVGQPTAALPHLKAALEFDRSQGQYWLSYIDALIQTGSPDVARQVLKQGRQQGLSGAAVDAFEARLKEKDLAVAQSSASRQPALNNVLPISTKIQQSGKKKLKTKSANAHQTPAPHEINTLLALMNGGRYPEAASLAQAMTVRFPLHGLSWMLLGVASMQMGQGANALASMQKAAELSPGDAEVRSNLGATLKKLGRLEEAASSFRKALKIKPDFAEAHYNLGATLQGLARLNEAEASYRRALKIKPDYADAHSNLGLILRDLGRPIEAETSCRRALQLNPHSAEAHNNLGLALKDMGHPNEAETCYRRALEINPYSAEAHNNLGYTLQSLGRLEEAEASFLRTLQIKPDHVGAHINLGITLNDLGRLDEAESSFRQALQIKPGHAEAHNNLGHILKEQGKMDAAVASYRRALELKPDYTDAHSNLLFSLNYTPAISPAHCLEEARRYGQKAGAMAASRFAGWSCAMRPQRLRVGLVSGDFRNHPVGYFLESLLSNLAPEAIELFAYPTDARTDQLTGRIKPRFSAWRPLFGKSDEAAARLIHGDGVHVLLDISGHTAGNRLPVFAWKPAPVQASWLGYFATTGVAEMDYLIADPWVLPETEEAHFTEKIWRLPETRLCFTAPDVAVEVSPLPALANGYITFGCFNNLTKMNDEVVALWAKVLATVPGSRLLLKAKQLANDALQKNTRSRFAAHGIEADRLVLEPPELRAQYLAAYHRVDIALDPFPYPGGTTSVEGLWMGVPVLTLAGERFLSRQGVGILMNAGLAEWVAADADDYVARAASHAADLQRLSDLRGGLRQRALASPVFDAPRFARNFEAALRGMWQQWCDEQT